MKMICLIGSFVAWVAGAETFPMLRQTESGFEIRHTGKEDWAFYAFPAIPVAAGDEFVFSCTVGKHASATPPYRPVLSIVLWNAEGKVLS